MYFFVNQYLLGSNSSVEHAELKQLALLKKHGGEAKLVTRNFDLVLHDTVKKFGLTNDQIVSVYDFFANTTDYQGEKLHTEDLHLSINCQIGTGNNYHEVKDSDRLVYKVYFAAGTIGQVNHVDYFDPAGDMTLHQQYDIRGLKTTDEFFGGGGQGYYARYYRPNGETYLERCFVKSVENTPANLLNVLRNYWGQDRFFDSLEDLSIFFLDELSKADGEDSAFIADQPAVVTKPVQSMVTKARKFLQFLMNQINDGQNSINGPLNPMLQGPVTMDADKWDDVTTMTAKQAEILQQQTHNIVPIYVINGTPVPANYARISEADRTPGQLIYVGRLTGGKQTSQLINMFAQIHQQVSESKLTSYGYGTGEDMDSYKKWVKNFGLDRSIEFAGYQISLDEAYDQAQLFVDVSRIDAQPLVMGEALNHGIPVVSYGYLCGPRKIVVSGKNGRIIPLNNQGQFIQAVVKLLQDRGELQSLSTGAHGDLDELAEKKTWK